MANDKDFLLKNAVEVGKDIKVTLGSITSSDIDLATGNYFADTLAANTTYTISNAGDVQSFQLEVTGGSTAYDLAAATYESKSFNTTKSQTFQIAFDPSGTKLFTANNDDDRVYEYALSTAWDVSTASYNNLAGIASQEANISGLAFKTDGTKFYIVGTTNATVYQYSVSSAWSLSGATYESKSFGISSQATDPRSIAFSSDGTKMYMLGFTSSTIYQYTLSTAWDVSTASYDSVSYNSSIFQPYGMFFNPDGLSFFVLSTAYQTITKFSLSTAWDLSTAATTGVSYDSSSEGSASFGLTFKDDGTNMYVNKNGTVYQYSTATPATVTWPTSIEWAGGVAPSAPAAGETDVFTFVTDDGGTSYVGLKTADNLS